MVGFTGIRLWKHENELCQSKSQYHFLSCLTFCIGRGHEQAAMTVRVCKGQNKSQIRVKSVFRATGQSKVA